MEAMLSQLDAKNLEAEALTTSISTLRDEFTKLFAQPSVTHAKSAGPDARIDSADASKKRKRASDDDEPVSNWKPKFHAFLDKLLVKVVSIRKSKRISKEEMLAIHISAFNTYMHFIAHGLSLPNQAAQGAGGPMLSWEVVLRVVQTLLAAGGSEAEAEYTMSTEAAALAGSGPRPIAVPPAVLPFLTANLDVARRVLRSEFCDDYDDVRLAVLKAIKDVAKARVQAQGAGKVGAEVGPDPRSAVLHCSPSIFARNAVEILLGIALPTHASEWEGEERSSYAEEQVGEELVAWAKAAGVDLHWAPDIFNQNKKAGSGVGADDDEDGKGKAKFLSADSDEEDGNDSRALALMKTPAPTSAPIPASPSGPAWTSYIEHRKAYAEAWCAVLGGTLLPDVLRRVLLALPGRILPLFPGRTSLLLADFLTGAVDGGGSTALLALESLFALMQGQGLEVPKFYPRLYALLGSPDTASARYKARFFVLLDLFLSSPALPAYTAAAFAKRAARIALTASPAYARLAIALIHNLIVRHPRALVPLMHRVGPSAPAHAGTSSVVGGAWPASADPFDALTDDPSLCHALDSSLWEIPALACHAAAPVAHSARALAESTDHARAEADLEELAGADSGASAGKATPGGKKGGPGSGLRDLSYAAMACAELGRRVRAKPKAGGVKAGGKEKEEGEQREWTHVEVHFEYVKQAGLLTSTVHGAIAGQAVSILSLATDMSS